MNRQKSFNENMKLYLVATPIGNLEDMTFRAIRTLKEVDAIFCEDKRVSIKLLNHFEIKNKLYSYHEHNKDKAKFEILSLLESGKNVALISDAGYPLISDPGYELIDIIVKNNFNVINIPGANAMLSSLVVSNLMTNSFTFHGFLDVKESKKKKKLEEIKDLKWTNVFYESPHRIQKTLITIKEVLGNRKICICRELTKKFEEVIRGDIDSIIPIADSFKGEMVIVVEGSTEEVDYSNISIVDHVNQYINNGLDKMDAIKKVSRERGVKKADIYKAYLN